ncbi:MAG: GNAT family N-acetyltransferase [Lacrimispora celerecrescens]|nr:GNAT family N-acetyltransferase [Lacrimispora celerecrescens]
MEFRELMEEELNIELFNDFDRFQEVRECWRKENGIWVIKQNSFTEQWKGEEYEVLVKCLKHTVTTGGVVFGCFLEGKLKGFASVEGVPLGMEGQYLDLSSLHVSRDLRGRKAGSRLFQMAAQWARIQGAGKLYISSHSSVETQAFYKSMGCEEAMECSREHVEREPCDCQLEYVLDRKVILYIAVSLDGYIADEAGGVDWLGGQDKAYKGDYGYGRFEKQVDTVIMGYRTYRQVVTELSPEAWPYPGKETWVLTHREMEDRTGIQFTGEPLDTLLSGLKKKEGKAVWICGGAQLVNQLMEKDLIDEYHLTLMPVLLGGGARLFEKTGKQILLKLVSSETENGVIDCIYRKR